MKIFLLLAEPFISHISGFLLAILILNLFSLLILTFLKKKTNKIKSLNIFIVVSTVFLGIYLRLCLAYFSLGNADIESYNQVVKLLLRRENIYAVTHRYNYSPLWSLILVILYKFNDLFPSLSFHFLIRFFLTLVDILSLTFLYKISKLKKISFAKVAVGFFLNPINILITGHHGQFDNISILMILIGIFTFLKLKKKKLAWMFFLIGGIVKHIVFNQILTILNFCFKNKKKVFIFFCFSIIIFLLTFVPFWERGKEGIIKNVFLYRSQEGQYGITYFLNSNNLTQGISGYYGYVFIISYFLFAFLFRGKNLIETVLINSLFFLTFTSGMADQYFVLPLAFASINGSFWFTVYTLVVSLYLFRSPAQLGLSRYNFVSGTLVWFVILIWFISEQNTPAFMQRMKRILREKKIPWLLSHGRFIIEFIKNQKSSK